MMMARMMMMVMMLMMMIMVMMVMVMMNVMKKCPMLTLSRPKWSILDVKWAFRRPTGASGTKSCHFDENIQIPMLF